MKFALATPLVALMLTASLSTPAVAAAPGCVSPTVTENQKQSSKAAAKSDAQMLANAIESYAVDHDSYPKAKRVTKRWIKRNTGGFTKGNSLTKYRRVAATQKQPQDYKFRIDAVHGGFAKYRGSTGLYKSGVRPTCTS